MTTLPEAAQQALEAMDCPGKAKTADEQAAITALRAALAEPDRKPLTEEEMRECAQAMDAEPLAEGWFELIKFARAIERAHGIIEPGIKEDK